jgi:hypothetical protein
MPRVHLLYTFIQEVPMPKNLGAQGSADAKTAADNVRIAEDSMVVRPGKVSRQRYE